MTTTTATQPLVFRGHEITAANYRNLHKYAGRLSDTALQADVRFGWPGTARAAGYLLQVPEEVRADVESDGIIDANVSGGRHADGISRAVRRWNSGDHSLPYVNANRRMLTRERETRQATGRMVLETTQQAFGHLAVPGSLSTH